MEEYFKILGLHPTATKAEIKKAFRKLVLKYHPDVNSNPDAQQRFVQIQTAYEYLYNEKEILKPLVQKETAAEKRKKEEKERLKKARERFSEQKRQEQAANERYYTSLTTGKNWRIFKIGTILCTMLAVLLIIEFALPKHYQSDQILRFSKQTYGGMAKQSVMLFTLENHGNIWVENKGLLQIFEDQECIVEKTWLLHQPIAVVHSYRNEPLRHGVDFSVYALFPISAALLLTPLFTMWYKRRNAKFTILYCACYYALFPLVLLFLISENHWFHLLTLGYY